MLVPKRVKHRKVQRGSMKGKAKGGTRLNHGEYGIQALEAAWITNRQIEAARIAMTLSLIHILCCIAWWRCWLIRM